MKMVNNVLMAVAMEAFTEAASLGQSLGISRRAIFDRLFDGPIVPPFIRVKLHESKSIGPTMRSFHCDRFKRICISRR